MSAWLSACTVLPYAVLIVCVPFPFGVCGEDLEFDCIIIIIIIIIKSLFKEDYISSTYILIYHMVLLNLNNKTYKHLNIIYTYVIYILYN